MILSVPSGWIREFFGFIPAPDPGSALQNLRCQQRMFLALGEPSLASPSTLNPKIPRHHLPSLPAAPRAACTNISCQTPLYFSLLSGGKCKSTQEQGELLIKAREELQAGSPWRHELEKGSVLCIIYYINYINYFNFTWVCSVASFHGVVQMFSDRSSIVKLCFFILMGVPGSLSFLGFNCCSLFFQNAARNPDPWNSELSRGIPREPFPTKSEFQPWTKLTSPIKFHFRDSRNASSPGFSVPGSQAVSKPHQGAPGDAFEEFPRAFGAV